jgi:hypothetical protein
MQVELSYSALVTEGARATVHLQALSRTGAVLTSERVELRPNGAEFTPSKLTADVPPETRTWVVTLGLGGRGTAWFDALELRGGK